MTTHNSSNNTTDEAQLPKWAKDVHHFWFEALKPQDWFAGGEPVDELVRARFAATFADLSGSVPEGALTDPRIALSAVILFDQFPRNLFRGTAKAFAFDDLALAIARNALDRGFDAEVSPQERMFLYLPFEHSEVLADGERSVALFKSLGDETALAYAVEHRDILARFGRYPHRNGVLGRDSTDEEKAFLASHEGFGQ